MKTDTTIDVFDSLGERYEKAFKLFLDHTDQKIRAREKLEDLIRSLSKRDTLIDVGAGTGMVTAWLEPHFHHTVAIEPNLTLTKELKARCPSAKLITDPIEQVALPRVGNLVLCSHVFYYLNPETWVDVVKRLGSWTADGGMAVIILQNPETDCMKMFKHFRGQSFDLRDRVVKIDGSDGLSVEIQTVPSMIETTDLQTATHIAEFVINLTPMSVPPKEADVRQYVERHFKRDANLYRFSCHQDFMILRRK